ncbi:acyl-coenzyme A thioesterase 5 [Salminus brasiliensis]|uniref:acyl-coenzyme A thioesterase 5 n=1 Tax=Salminus brasiliensis TaxID=930266 RepID=UPI003B83726B
MALLLRRFSKVMQRNALIKTYSDSGVRLRILPSTSCSYEDPVQIKVSGLTPRQHVEMRSHLKDDKGVVFKAAATYQADGSGEVDLSRHSSLVGSYTGVEPMGLFWSMKPDVPHSKVVKRDGSTPLHVHIEACSGGETLAKETNERHFASHGVRRVPVSDGRIRGTLFIPPGEGPFPGIIDLYTLGGILCEPRAALLASNGFVTLALALYGYQDMPKKIEKLELEYFEEALTFLQKLPQVKKTGVGIVSISKSGELALSMASLLPNVKATAWINGNIANVIFPLHYKDIVFPPLTVSMERITVTPSGVLDIRDALEDPMLKENHASVMPIERASCNFLFVVSEDDRNWNSAYYAEQASNILKAHGKTNYEVVSYPKAGHFLEVPYMPHYPSGIHAAVGQAVAFGGEPKAHADAQVDAWRRVLEFFKKHLDCDNGPFKSLLEPKRQLKDE